MEAVIRVHFKKILGKKVDDKLIKSNPKLPERTRETTAILCRKIKEYFDTYKIKTGVSFEMENG